MRNLALVDDSAIRFYRTEQVVCGKAVDVVLVESEQLVYLPRAFICERGSWNRADDWANLIDEHADFLESIDECDGEFAGLRRQLDDARLRPDCIEHQIVRQLIDHHLRDFGRSDYLRRAELRERLREYEKFVLNRHVLVVHATTHRIHEVVSDHAYARILIHGVCDETAIG